LSKKKKSFFLLSGGGVPKVTNPGKASKGGFGKGTKSKKGKR